MKPRLPALIAILFLVPLSSFGQSILSFPRIIPPGEFRTTGFAIVNPGVTNATVAFNLYGPDGKSQRSSTQIITARGQLAKLNQELFGDSDSAGWVQATSSTSGLQGFWFGGDFKAFADGAEAAPSSSDLVVPLITPQTEIDIANTSSADVTVRMELLDEGGFAEGIPLPQLIPAKGFFKADLSLFHLNDFSLPSHMRITCPCEGAAFAATTIARDFIVGPSWSVANGLPISTLAPTITFPHVVEGPLGSANWRSYLGIMNLSNSENNVNISFMSEAGTIVQAPFQRTIPPNGAIRGEIRDYGLTAPFQNGWVRVTSTNGLPLSGYLAYADIVAGGVAVVPPQQNAQTALLFAHIADLPPWWTGLALLNATAGPANVEVFALNPNGSLIGNTNFSLQSGAKTAKLLSEWIPQTQSRTSDGGFVFVRSNVPLFGIELFFSRSLQILSNVAAGRVLPGITFVPPSP